MTEQFRMLLVEDNPKDAELVLRELKRGGLDFQRRLVQTESDFRRELDEFQPHLVISDFSMPQFSGRTALAIARESQADIPFIFISGTIGEDVAVEMMKAGADDYVMKNNLARLLPALERELREAEVRHARTAAEGALRQSEVKFRELIEQASDGIFLTDKDGKFILVNSRYCEMLGYSEDELLRLHSEMTYPEGEREKRAQHRAELRERKWGLYERMVLRKDGTCFPAEVSIKLLGRDNVQGIVRDISDRKKAQEVLTESEERFRQLAENIKEVFWLTDPSKNEMLYVSPAYEEIWGRSCQSLYASPRTWLEAIHPEDRARVLEAAIARQARGDYNEEYRIVRTDGSIRWIRDRAFPVLDPLGTVYRIAGVAEDITDSKAQQDKIARLTRIYAVLSGVNALIVRVRDKDELFREACKIAVEAGKFRFAWIGVVDSNALQLTPVAWGGVEQGFLAAVRTRLSLGESDPKGRSLVVQAVLAKEAMVSNDVANDPRIHFKREHAEQGIRSLAVFPLIVSETVVGILALHAAERGFFVDEEMRLLTELAGDISFALEHIAKAEKLNYLAYYDSLTGFANRDLLHERLTQSVRSAARDKRKLALIVMDIERFKAVNDSFGRQAGDELLRQFAAGLLRVVGDPTRIARVGGDQFTALLRGLKAEDDVMQFYEHRLRECFDQPFRIGNHDLRISARAGIAIFPDDGADADALFLNAEAALKRAKATGERLMFFTQQMTEKVGERLKLETKLRQALEREEFVLHYQPKVDTATRRTAGVEALIRWQSPEMGLVPPMQFIPLLEDTGLILEVGVWALNRAVLDHREWIERGFDAPRIAVNVSPIQLRRPEFVEVVRKAVQHMTPSGLDLEITESLVMTDIERTMEKLEAVRMLGLGIAIDDFGTGYSSLGYLAKLPVESLKIDRSFIITMLKDPHTMTLVSTIVSLAHSLSLKVVAEGVDAEEQAAVLKRLGCDQMQGYLFSKPLPFDDVTALLGRGAGKGKARRKS